MRIAENGAKPAAGVPAAARARAIPGNRMPADDATRASGIGARSAVTAHAIISAGPIHKNRSIDGHIVGSEQIDGGIECISQENEGAGATNVNGRTLENTVRRNTEGYRLIVGNVDWPIRAVT